MTDVVSDAPPRAATGSIAPRGDAQASSWSPSHLDQVIRPIVKWAGGKTRLLPELVRRVPDFVDYYEPFAGGLALFLRLSTMDLRGVRNQDLGWWSDSHRAHLADANDDLIVTYRAIADSPGGVSQHVEAHRALHCEDHYYATRAAWNDPTQRVQQTLSRIAANFLYLNKAGFNGLWRVNRDGRHNVPFGRSAGGGGPSLPTLADLESVSWALGRVAALSCEDFRVSTATAGAGDFVYFDPPYVPRGETSDFTAYTTDGFGADDHADLARCSRDLAARGVHVMLSNSDTPMVRDLYQGFRVETVMAPRSINSRGSGRGKIAELLITSDGCRGKS
jgi:DNA adenine methylase